MPIYISSLSYLLKITSNQQNTSQHFKKLQMKKVELVFIPSPGLSHLVATVEAAKLLLDRDDRLSITVLIMKLRKDPTVEDYTRKTSSDPNASPRLHFTHLPSPAETPAVAGPAFDLIDAQITHVREAVSNSVKHPSVPGSQVAGLVLDMFCTKFMEVGDEFKIPSYIFFTSGAVGLCTFQFALSVKYELHQELTQFNNSDAELQMPGFSQPVPASMLPAVFVDGSPMVNAFLNNFKRITETKGIMVNSFYELESYGIDYLASDGKTPKIYPVGPILHSGGEDLEDDDVKKWLDCQPENSVVFLCFGTMGSFEKAQVKEIAMALENSGHRFLWSLRKPGAKGSSELVKEYESFEEVLPEGFLERTKEVGKVIGWAKQVAVLSHPAVGGFVSHCGWNSTLESVWSGVPIAAFPLYAEQQINAFLLVKEKGIAEAIKLDYKLDLHRESPPEIVGSEKIEAAIRRIMAEGGGVREKMEEMHKKARSALEEGGSSYNAQCLFIEDVIKNIS